MKKKFLVTGAKGFVGHHWCEKLINKGHFVEALDIKENINPIKNKNFKYYRKSVFDYKFVEKLIKRNDIICHFAGIAEPKEYLKRAPQVIELTVLPSFKIIELCAKHKKKLIYTSTSEIYGKSNKTPFAENDDRVLGSANKNRWCYSASKSVVEHYIHAHSFKNGLNFIIFRLFNIFGPGLKGRVVDEFINKCLINNDLLINGDGKQTRCFLYIDDCMDAFFKIISKKETLNETFNIGSNKETNIIDFARIVIALTKSKSKIIKNSSQMIKLGGYEDIKRRVPSLKKIRKYINWKPKISLKTGLKKTIETIDI